MSNVQAERIGGNHVFFERGSTTGGLRRYVEATGPDVIKVILNMAHLPLAADVLSGWTTTLVEAGGGESTVTAADVSGGALLLTSDANDNDGICLQKLGECFEFTTGQRLVYFRIKFKINDATQTDFFVGFGITDTTPLGGISDGVYFQKDDASTAIKATTEKDSTETNTAAVATLVDDTEITLEILFTGGTSVKFYADGALVATHTANIVEDELLTPTIHFLTGEAVANTMQISEAVWLQIGR